MNKKKDPSLVAAKTVLIILCVALLFAFAATCYKYYNISFNNNILTQDDKVGILDIFSVSEEKMTYAEGIIVDSVDISGLTKEQAEQLVKNVSPQMLEKIRIVNGEKSVELDLSKAAGTKNLEETLSSALAIGNVGTRAERKLERKNVAEKAMELKTKVIYDLTPISDLVEAAALELSYAPVEPSVKVKQNITSQATSAEDVFDFVQGTPGSKVDAQTLMQSVQTAVNEGRDLETLEAPQVPVAVLTKVEDLKGNFSLISSATSSFAKPPYNESNRMKNIEKAAGIISGHVLQPQEVFSFNEVLGPRTSSTGWFAAGAISEGISVKEVGGGICQVSSTAYNSVLTSDFEIVERHPHSWPLSYISTGQDATISTGGPDFKFKNNRKTPVVLVAKFDVEQKTLTIEFYGEPVTDSMEIKLVSERTGTISQPKSQTIRINSMKPGTQNTVRNGRPGSKYDTYKEYYKDGALVKRELAYKTVYRTIASIIEVGPAAPKVVAPSSSTTNDNAGIIDIPSEQPEPAGEIEIPDEGIIG